MVRPLRLFVLLLTLWSFSHIASTAANPSYVYVEVPGISADRGFTELRNELRTIPQLGEIEFCEGLGLAIIAVHGDLTHTKSQINSLLHKLRYKYSIKRDADIGAVRDLCERQSHKRPH